MKDQQKRIVTMAMIWIAAVGFAATPAWWRAFRDFVSSKTGGPVPVASGSGGGGGNANLQP